VLSNCSRPLVSLRPLVKLSQPSRFVEPSIPEQMRRAVDHTGAVREKPARTTAAGAPDKPVHSTGPVSHEHPFARFVAMIVPWLLMSGL
jgi:hypothetical protein